MVLDGERALAGGHQLTGHTANGALDGLPPVAWRNRIIGTLASLAPLTELTTLRCPDCSLFGTTADLSNFRKLRILELSTGSGRLIHGQLRDLSALVELEQLMIARPKGIEGNVAALRPLGKLRLLDLNEQWGRHASGPIPSGCIGVGKIAGDSSCCAHLAPVLQPSPLPHAKARRPHNRPTNAYGGRRAVACL